MADQISDIELSQLLNSGSTLPYDQQEIETVMRKLLYENGVSDVLYEGSNISQLTTVISYVIGTLNVNTAINLQETLLPLATKRMNVLLGARQLGYQPHNKIAYKYTLNLTPKYDQTKTIKDADGRDVLDTHDKTPNKVTLVQNTVFQSGSTQYYYKGPTFDLFNFSNWDIQFKNSHPNYVYEDFFTEIEVTEGTMISYLDDPTLEFVVKDYTNQYGEAEAKQDYLIPHNNVEENGLQVFVESLDYTQGIVAGSRPVSIIEKFKSKYFLIDETFTYEQNKFIRMENIILQYPTIFFEYSGMGQPLNTGDRVYVNVFTTLGADGKASNKFIVGTSGADQIMAVESFKLFSKGSDEESTENIKKNATVFNNTANRAVTKLDYIAITNRHEYVKEAEAWGGEEEVYPAGDLLAGTPQLGHIWFSTVPHYDKGEPMYTSPSKEVAADLSTTPPIAHEPEILEQYKYYIGDAVQNDKTQWENWYQKDANIIPDANNNINTITEYLNHYKIITMQLHHRHPLYVNFDFTCDVVRYDLTKSKAEINKEVFNGINRYFNDQMETFNKEYLNSNLQRLLDIILSFQSGIGYTLEAKGVLTSNMKDSNAGDLIYCDLDFPFENMFKDVSGEIDITLLPSIDTISFGNEIGASDLTVNYAGLSTLVASDLGATTEILYGGTQVGTYRVNNELSKIELIFDFDGAGLEDIIFNDVTDPTNPIPKYAEFNLIYPYTSGYNYNIPFKGNTIPRLRSVSFKDN